MAETVRGDMKAFFTVEDGKSSPTEILEALNAFNAEGRPIWKPMHLQPIYGGMSLSQLPVGFVEIQMLISSTERV